MSRKYPYLNSVVFNDQTIKKLETCKINIETKSDEITKDVNHLTLNGNIENISTEIGKDEINSISKSNVSACHTKENHCLQLSKNSNCDSSISSLSSLTSTSDLSYIGNNSVDVNDGRIIDSQQTKIPLKTGLLNHFSNFIGRNKSRKLSAESSVKSTTCLILNDRPSGLPPKNPLEVRRHNEEYLKLINSIKKKEQQKCQEHKVREKSKLNHEDRQYELITVWKDLIIPKWEHQRHSKFVRQLWWEGIPTSVRDKVWCMCIPNVLNLTPNHYENFLSQMLERIERYRESIPSSSSSVSSTVDAIPVSESPPSISNEYQSNNDLLQHSQLTTSIISNKSVESPSNTLETVKPRASSTGVNPNRDSILSAYDFYISETPISLHSKRSSGSYSNNIPTVNGKDHSKMNGDSSNNTNTTTTTDNVSTTSNNHSDIRQILLNTIKLDVSRTFPNLNLFQEGGPHHDSLHRLLGAYTCYRPDIGYVQGMSFLAAILMLVMHPQHAFICFANILEMPCHNAFYSLDETQFLVHIETFKVLLITFLPQLSQHFTNHHLDLNIFLCDWLFTIYSRALTLETALRVWDVFCRDGEVALYRAGLGILRCYEIQLLGSDFEEMAGFLTGQMPKTLTPTILVEQMRAIKLGRKQFKSTISEVRRQISSSKS